MSTIVAGYDASDSASDAVRFAARLARALDAPLVVTFVYHLDRIDELDTPEWRGFLRDVAARELAGAGELAPEAELVPWGADSPAKGLQEIAAERSAQMIVVGSTEKGPIGRVVPGSVGQRLLAGAPCPVAVSPRGWTAADAWPEQVLVGYDGTPEAERALSVGIDLAAALGAAIRVLTVAERLPEPVTAVPGMPQPPRMPPGERERLVTERHALQERRLHEALARNRADVPAEGAVSEGDPAHVIVEEAGPNALIVVGSRGYGPVGAVLLGSVSAAVIRAARSPVVVTPRSMG